MNNQSIENQIQEKLKQLYREKGKVIISEVSILEEEPKRCIAIIAFKDYVIDVLPFFSVTRIEFDTVTIYCNFDYTKLLNYV